MVRKLCIVILALILICACSTTKAVDKPKEDISEITYEIVNVAPEEEVVAEPVPVKEESKPVAREESPAATKETVDFAISIDKPAEAKEEVIATIPDESVAVKKELSQKADAPVAAPAAEEKESVAPDVFELGGTENPPKEPNISIGEDVITKDPLTEVALDLMGCFIVIIVLFTVSVAIRSANKIMLPKGIALLIASLFTGLPILISYLVIGPSKYWFTYLILLFSYFIFRAKDRPNHFE